ncbi:thiamine-phosphate pyrophosphorylase [Roseovarius albus]|uniref:Thiamine-phosphate pyrophosphorylase n=1 Tax=Roseovarius albus TaxID=1247867 RepID=A0A1X6YXK3_9RHOB|nr:thiamine phosphate synthase [Roseovarius albus]SLN34619.1 thiamine-phosphate pyrophosphorylase [Roseovarius albus]
MSEAEHAQIYLITPPEIELSRFPDQLASVLDAQEIACVRLALSSHDEDTLSRAADACRAATHERDVALVLDTHFLLAERLGLDGVHLLDGARTVRTARKELGPDAIVGCFCGNSSHDGMSAGESGADYVSFGPVGASNLGDGSQAKKDLFDWWSQMIEVPVVAEGALDLNLVRTLSPYTDFFGIGEELWQTEDPAQAIKHFSTAIENGVS